MAKPTNSTPQVDIHPTLHNFHVNVKMFGAVGDNTADDTAAIQAALNTTPQYATNGLGTVYFPPGVYKLSGPLSIPTGSVRIALIGPPNAAKGPAAGAYLRQTVANSDTIQITTSASTHTYVIDGIHIIYDSLGTGVGINANMLGDTPIMGALRLKDVVVQGAGTGFTAGGSVGMEFDNCAFNGCTVGVNTAHSSGTNWNLTHFSQCYFRTNITAGIRCSNGSGMWAPQFESCVFESNTGPSILVDTGSVGLNWATFTNCWWEAGSSDCIVAKASIQIPTFTGCNITPDANINFITIDAALGSTVHVTGPTFIGCSTVIGGSKYLLTHTAATDPQVTGDPGFTKVVILGNVGGRMKGLFTPHTGDTNMHLFSAAQSTDIIADGVTGEKPAYIMLDSGSNSNAWVDSGSGRAVAKDGVQTKYLSGAGKTTVVDGDFTKTPTNGTIAVHYDTTGAKGYISFRANGVWKVATPGGI